MPNPFTPSLRTSDLLSPGLLSSDLLVPGVAGGVVAAIGDAVRWLGEHRADVLLVAGTVVVAGLTVAVYRAVVRDRLADVATWVAVVIATAFSAEGMWEVAREGLGLSVWQAAGLFAAAEAAMTSEAIRARRRRDQGRHPGAHGTAVWVIATCAGGVAAMNADSVVEVPVRIGMPLLAAALWWLELTSESTATRADAISWRLTPRRILVRIGLAEPGERDVSEVDRDRRITALTTTAHRVHHGRILRRLHTIRLRRLALAADDAMVTEARNRVHRVHHIVALTAPTPAPTGTASGPDTTADRGDCGLTENLPRGNALTAGPDEADVQPDRTGTPGQADVRTGHSRHVRTRRPGRGTDTAAEIRRLHAAHPDMTQDEIAAQVGVSDRTVRRHLAAAMNGQAHHADVQDTKGES